VNGGNGGNGGPSFELVNARRLRIHEQVDPGLVDFLERAIEAEGVLWDPIWVARGNGFDVVLNGHHRFNALKRLGATKIPAFVFNYHDPVVKLDRWGEGPPVTKAEVLRRAQRRRPFPPKTTRHTILVELPKHPTPLVDLVRSPRALAQAEAPRPSPMGRPRSAGGA
jgi:hypothetical protein